MSMNKNHYFGLGIIVDNPKKDNSEKILKWELSNQIFGDVDYMAIHNEELRLPFKNKSKPIAVITPNKSTKFDNYTPFNLGLIPVEELNIIKIQFYQEFMEYIQALRNLFEFVDVEFVYMTYSS